MPTKPDNFSTKHSQKLAKSIYQHCLEQKKILTTAESCTGGLLSAHITDIAGSSAIFDRAFITYSNSAKQDMINVSEKSLNLYGAVSEVVAMEMLNGALKRSNANLGVSVSGIAGPGGGSDEKPVGTVCFSWGDKTKQYSSTEHFKGNRQQVRLAAVNFAFEKLLDFISKQG